MGNLTGRFSNNAKDLSSVSVDSQPAKADTAMVKLKDSAPEKVSAPKSKLAKTMTKATSKKVIYRVIAGSFSEYTNAINELNRIKSLGFDGYVWSLTSPTNGVSYKVQIGAFSNRSTADKLVGRLKSKQINSYISKH